MKGAIDWSVEKIFFIVILLIQNFNKKEGRPITYDKKLHEPMLTRPGVVDIIYAFYGPVT